MSVSKKILFNLLNITIYLLSPINSHWACHIIFSKHNATEGEHDNRSHVWQPTSYISLVDHNALLPSTSNPYQSILFPRYFIYFWKWKTTNKKIMLTIELEEWLTNHNEPK